MKIYEIIEKYNLSFTQLLNPQKEYIFTCVLDNALKLQKDFIYLPFASSLKEIPDLITKAMKNSCCKGVVINKKWYSDFKSFLDPLMLNFEFFGQAGNIYNLAYSLAQDNSKDLKVRTITIAGTEETSTVKEILAESIKANGYRVSCAQIHWSFWQKSVEPLLSADENLDYALVEAIPKKAHMSDYAAMYYKNNVLFTNSKIFTMNIWQDLADLSEDILKILNYPERIQSVYTYFDNELVNCGISYLFQDRLHFVKDLEQVGFKQDFYYLGRCYNLAAAFLETNGIRTVKLSDFEESEQLYFERTSGNRDYFVLNPQKVSVNSLKESALLFSKKYQNRQKIFVYEHITGLGDFKDGVYKDIFVHLAGLNPDVLILLETQKFKHYFKRYNNSAYVKYFPYKPGDTTKIRNIKRFFNGIAEDNCAVFVFSEHDLSFMREEQ